MAALFPRIKVWLANETLLAADVNAEFNNILNNLGLNKVGPYSTTVAKFQETFDPGDVGTESLPTTAMEEIQADRFLIKAITGEDQWYAQPTESLATLASAIGSDSFASRIISGVTDADGQPQHLVAPGGTSFLLGLNAAPTSFRYMVNRVQYTISADATLDMAGAAGLSGAASQATLSDPYNNTNAFSKVLGEMPGTRIEVNTVGAGWTARVDKLSAFKFTSGGSTEYFLGIYRSGGYIENCLRGFFFNSSGVNARVQLESLQVFSILALSYIFAKSDGTIVRNSSNNEPVVSGLEPAAPAAGDFWYDLAVQEWKQYSGTSWASANVTLIGLCAQSSTACEATRSSDRFQSYSALCDVSPQPSADGLTVREYRPGGIISCYGVTLPLSQAQLTWSTSTSLDTAVTMANYKVYYLYISNAFVPKISDIPPHDRQQDLKGYYHPSKPWRCIGFLTSDSAASFATTWPQALGGNTYLARGSVSSDKLMPYSNLGVTILGSGDANVQTAPNQVVQSTTDTKAVAGADWDIRVISSGRPIFLSFVGTITANEKTVAVAVQYRRSGVGGSYTTSKTFTYRSTTVSETVIFPGFMDALFLPQGDYQIRLDVTASGGGTFSVEGYLRGWEG